MTARKLNVPYGTTIYLTTPEEKYSFEILFDIHQGFVDIFYNNLNKFNELYEYTMTEIMKKIENIRATMDENQSIDIPLTIKINLFRKMINETEVLEVIDHIYAYSDSLTRKWKTMHLRGVVNTCAFLSLLSITNKMINEAFTYTPMSPKLIQIQANDLGILLRIETEDILTKLGKSTPYVNFKFSISEDATSTPQYKPTNMEEFEYSPLCIRTLRSEDKTMELGISQSRLTGISIVKDVQEKSYIVMH